MGGATSVMPVIRDAFSQQAADSTQWADTIDWTVRCDWMQVASSCIILYTHNIMLMTSARLVQVLKYHVFASFIADVIALLGRGVGPIPLP